MAFTTVPSIPIFEVYYGQSFWYSISQEHSARLYAAFQSGEKTSEYEYQCQSWFKKCIVDFERMEQISPQKPWEDLPKKKTDAFGMGNAIRTWSHSVLSSAILGPKKSFFFLGKNVQIPMNDSGNK